MLPDKNSPFWPIFKSVSLTLCMVYLISTGYREGWVTRADLPLVIKFAILTFGIDGLRYLIPGGSKDDKADQ